MRKLWWRRLEDRPQLPVGRRSCSTGLGRGASGFCGRRGGLDEVVDLLLDVGCGLYEGMRGKRRACTVSNGQGGRERTPKTDFHEVVDVGLDALHGGLFRLALLEECLLLS